MGLDVSTLFVANILVLVISSLAYVSVFARNQIDRYWLYWIGANLVLAAALLAYLVWPDLPVHLAVVPDALLVLGFVLRHAAARSFADRSIRLELFALPLLLVVAANLINNPAATFGLTNVVLTGLAVAVGWQFWRDYADRLFSRAGLVIVYTLMAASFAARAGQGLFVGDQIQSYIPYDVLLEIHLLVALIHVIAGSLFVLSLASEISANALREAARRDPLTGLLNRRAFDALLADKLGRDDVGLAVVDIDFFKSINDNYGHAVGDTVLKVVSQALLQAVGTRGEVARIGGEEFALVLNAVDAACTGTVAEAARQAVQDCVVRYGNHRIAVTASLGVSHVDYAGQTADALLDCADQALYRAKASGRNVCRAGQNRSWNSEHRSGFPPQNTKYLTVAS
ncbi:diguanylate cyclase (GGDEF)-like protein [Devosia subaequoris]|uniref:diguanylate cyclase n=1 Tax=Devosia subaequoris TaxID=395930 RepID=A0A7W6NB40_9HYPH|nr:GGDEF domain-containing protein [Devosia subaequoris]MBB4051567.1 diguanylate cyclase (GGDEF)-like protein [Devosia subaequoris]MCP1209159.1 GGDEF domain-containing protein [Devosia subaequoris]